MCNYLTHLLRIAVNIRYSPTTVEKSVPVHQDLCIIVFECIITNSLKENHTTDIFIFRSPL